MKRLMTFLAFVGVFFCIGLAVFGLLATEALRASQPPVSSTGISPLPSVAPKLLPTDTARPTQGDIAFVTIIPRDAVTPYITTTPESSPNRFGMTATAAPTLSSFLDATWTAEFHAAGTAAITYQDRWRATMTQWALEYAARQQTATAHAPKP